MDSPRVLIVSNNSFSKSSSNGRTLGNFFIGWPKDKIAQFCVSTTIPDYEVCNRYYAVSDREALHAFVRFKKARKCDIKNLLDTEGKVSLAKRRVYKTTLKELIREIVWGNKRWDSKEWRNWVRDFSPEIVVVLNSDSSFILSVATDIADQYQIPIVMYNSEGYYFFKKSFYTKDSMIDKMVFPIYHWLYRKRFQKMMRYTKVSVHLNDTLRNDYEREFGGCHDVLYSSSTIDYNLLSHIPPMPLFSYIGNMGYKRYEPLIELANALNSIDHRYRLHVYGSFPNPEAEMAIKGCQSIIYGGFVSYDEVKAIMAESTILFHVENQDPSFEQSLKYGFSTKIADSVSSGRPFVMFSSKKIAGAEYLIRNKIGWVADNTDSLKQCIHEVLNNERVRNSVLCSAHIVAEANHNNQANRNRFASILQSVVFK